MALARRHIPVERASTIGVLPQPYRTAAQFGRWSAQNVTTLLYVVVAAVVGFAVGRYRDRAYPYQNRGEALLMRSLRLHFAAPDYHLMNNVTLRVRDGTTQVDHILVARCGIFVIETKNYKGWIFADPKHANWTQVLFRRKFRFQNPMFQNYKHLCAVQDALDFLPRDAIKSVVVFTGDAEFKTAMPEGVYSIARFIDHLQHQRQDVLSLNRVQFCVGRLESTRLALTRETDVEHVQNLRRRHGGVDERAARGERRW